MLNPNNRRSDILKRVEKEGTVNITDLAQKGP